MNMTSADSRETAPDVARPSVSAAGQATFDLALRMGGLFLAIVLVAIIFLILKPNAFNVDVGISVLRAMSSVAVMSLGLTLVIVVGEIDLSFGAVYGLGANILAVLWILNGVPVYLALILAVGAGALVGLLNGGLVTWLKIPSFIVTLGSYNLLWGVSLWITHTSTFNPAYPPPGAEVPEAEFNFFTGLTASFGYHPISLEVLWMIALALVVGLLLHRSLFGFRLMAIGGNPAAARLARLPVIKYKILAFVISGVLASVAGILDFSFIQTVQPDSGLRFTFPVFAAVIIGGASLSGGKGTIIGTMGGALLLAELQQGLALLSPGPHVQQLFLGVVTIGAVALDLALTKLRARRAA
jgi:ribose/xylose/arabinose/galactoside ABC-type transport system permease subunit